MPQHLEFAQKTDQGRVRSNNEDFIAAAGRAEDFEKSRKGILFMLADGLGGMDYGEVASRQAVSMTEGLFLSLDGPPDPKWFRQAYEKINRRIFDLGAEMGSTTGMGTTLTVSYFGQDKHLMAHVGDSRVYRVRDRQLQCLSRDHSTGRHVLTRCVGCEPTVAVDVEGFDLKAGDIFLQCSDGLYSMVSEKDLFETLMHFDCRAACQEMVRLAYDGGGADNISVQVIRIK
jgi:PPM family protein phosphatase